MSEMQYVLVLTIPDAEDVFADPPQSIEAVSRDINDLLAVSGALPHATVRPLSEILAC